MMRRIQICLVALLLTAVSVPLFAASGDPVAIRRWPDGSTTIETHWNLTLRVLPAGILQSKATKDESASPAENSADRTVSVTDSLDHVLHRHANSGDIEWKPAPQNNEVLRQLNHEIRVRSLSSDSVASGGLRVQVDGVSIVLPASAIVPPAESVSEFAMKEEAPVDVLVAPKLTAATAPAYLAQAKGVAARWIILDEKNDFVAANMIADAIGSDPPAKSFGNTMAVSAVETKPKQSVVVVLRASPWAASKELEGLFQAMEGSCNDSQNVFSKLSARQMNFRPSNGTHTPRWNTEHMMGRQLLFFSQIYHELDPSIPVMDLNPKQMPPDYKAAHKDWDGAEESRQMERVSAFTRRFAYLLKDVELDKRAPGSRWTLRGLLKQMHRHYTEHTANTVKKFDLPDWPEE